MKAFKSIFSTEMKEALFSKAMTSVRFIGALSVLAAKIWIQEPSRSQPSTKSLAAKSTVGVWVGALRV